MIGRCGDDGSWMIAPVGADTPTVRIPRSRPPLEAIVAPPTHPLAVPFPVAVVSMVPHPRHDTRRPILVDVALDSDAFANDQLNPRRFFSSVAHPPGGSGRIEMVACRPSRAFLATSASSSQSKAPRPGRGSTSTTVLRHGPPVTMVRRGGSDCRRGHRAISEL